MLTVLMSARCPVLDTRCLTVTLALLTGTFICQGGAGFTGLGHLPGDEPITAAAQVSADGGTTVGVAAHVVPVPAPEDDDDDEEGKEVRQAMRWTVAGGLQGLGTLTGTVGSQALGVSADGTTIVGAVEITSDEDPKACRWTQATGLALLPGLPTDAIPSEAIGVSANGSVIVGYMDTELGIQAFRWTADTGPVGLGFFPNGIESRALAVSADGNVVAGWAHHQDGIRAFRWTAGDGLQNLGVLDGWTISRAAGVSADGSVVVGVIAKPSGSNQAFRWTAATGMQRLVPPAGGWECEATAVTADGTIVVGQMSTLESVEAFVWDATNGMRTLRSILEAAQVNLGDWRLDLATGVSADGKTIVGVGVNPAGNSEAWRAVLP